MPCRFDNDDPRKCDRCGSFLWVAEEGLFCGDCGVTMPCSMVLRSAANETMTPEPRGSAPATSRPSMDP